jgi:signal transduction histidine kinase
MVQERTKELSQAYDDLQETHEALKLTQDGLVHSEKMAALGQLIAGIAHEINTPLGAIQSSIQYTAKFLQENLQSLPQFFRELSPQQEQQFSELLNRAIEPGVPLSGRDRRQARRQLKVSLQELEISNAEAIASLLIDLGITHNLESLQSSLADPKAISILKMVRQFTRVHESTRDINTASDRAAKIVFALKTYARYDHSGELITANIADGIETVLTLYQNQLKYGITVTRKVESIAAIPCYFDELNQVWTNLIHNALQAMNYRGELTLVVYQAEASIIVEIHDTGPGIPPEIQAKIFEPFFTTKPPGEGSGLGLDIVKKIVDKHHGSISFQSTPGQTIFTVQIPTQITPSPQAPAALTHV